jgi:hypothetical protein
MSLDGRPKKRSRTQPPATSAKQPESASLRGPARRGRRMGGFGRVRGKGRATRQERPWHQHGMWCGPRYAARCAPVHGCKQGLGWAGSGINSAQRRPPTLSEPPALFSRHLAMTSVAFARERASSPLMGASGSACRVTRTPAASAPSQSVGLAGAAVVAAAASTRGALVRRAGRGGGPNGGPGPRNARVPHLSACHRRRLRGCCRCCCCRCCCCSNPRRQPRHLQ